MTPEDAPQPRLCLCERCGKPKSRYYNSGRLCFACQARPVKILVPGVKRRAASKSACAGNGL